MAQGTSQIPNTRNMGLGFETTFAKGNEQRWKGTQDRGIWDLLYNPGWDINDKMLIMPVTCQGF